MRSARRLAAEGVTRLTAAAPTVTLSRLQSGAGHLELTLHRPPASGDLTLSCLYELDNRVQGAIHPAGASGAPADALLPLLRLHSRPEGETITVDLRQIGLLRRAVVYTSSPPTPAPPAWSGVLSVTTFGGARIEIPVETQPASGTLALATIYNVRGELVLRAEMERFEGPVQDAARAFGYDAWIDTPLP